MVCNIIVCAVPVGTGANIMGIQLRMSGLLISTVRRGPCMQVGTTGMMGMDMIEEMMENILIRAVMTTSGHWILLRSLLNPVMLQDYICRCCFDNNRLVTHGLISICRLEILARALLSMRM